MQNKIAKFLAFRLLALIMMPYSASAAAATCSYNLDYSIADTVDQAYESVSYQVPAPAATACKNVPNELPAGAGTVDVLQGQAFQSL